MYRRPSTSSCGTATTRTVYSEIEWGLNFRKKAKKERDAAVRNCDRKKKKKKNGKPSNPCAKMDELFETLNADGRKQYADPFEVIRKEMKRARIANRCKSKNKNGENKTKIVDRNTLTHRQHIELLARPRGFPQDVNCEKKSPKRKKRKRKKCCKPQDESYLSPRMKQLAMPSKRMVYCTWADYQHILDAGTVERMENILHAGTGHNLEANEAAKYFKDEERRRRKPKVSKQQKRKERAEENWMKNEINILADLIVHDIATNPLHPENYCHMQLTSTLIATLRYKGYKIKPINRNTKSYKKRTVLEILDHVSVWSDQIFAKAELLDTKLHVKRYERMLASYQAQMREREKSDKSRKSSVSFKERKGNSLDVFDKLSYAKDGELIETFIRTLESASVGDLEAVIHHESLSDSTYRQLLDKLWSLRDGDVNAETLKKLQVRSLKDEMTRWTKRKRPEQLGDEVTKAVEAISECLLRFFKSSAAKERSALNEEDLKRTSEVDQLKKSNEVLRTMSETVDFSDIPEYKDANEFLESTPPADETDDEQGYFDQSQFVGIQDDEEGG